MTVQSPPIQEKTTEKSGRFPFVWLDWFDLIRGLIEKNAEDIAAIIGGASIRAYRAENSNYVIVLNDGVIDCVANSFTVTLPTAVSKTGVFYDIKNSGTGVIMLEGDSSETIDGTLNITLSAGDSITVLSNNANWIIL